ncbi:hypothetical protein [Bacillus sp. EAC]|uniref:hypothetical protein n=1 Tax=Bacillus sp. EAC TaxID=1978338 RepID=UPI000B437E96|nr:hypothetical protein [Bacillus sp. EAC]
MFWSSIFGGILTFGAWVWYYTDLRKRINKKNSTNEMTLFSVKANDSSISNKYKIMRSKGTNTRFTMNQYTRKVFKWIVGPYSHSILLLLLMISFFNYWSLFFIIASIKESVTHYVEKYGIGKSFYEGIFFGFFGSILLLFIHHFALKYWLHHRKIRTVVCFVFLNYAYFIFLILFNIYVYISLLKENRI